MSSDGKGLVTAKDLPRQEHPDFPNSSQTSTYLTHPYQDDNNERAKTRAPTSGSRGARPAGRWTGEMSCRRGLHLVHG